MCKLSDKYQQCIALEGEKPRWGCIVKVFLTKRGMLGRDKSTGRRVQYLSGTTNVWKEVIRV